MPNTKYLNRAVTEAAITKTHPELHEEEPFRAWVRALTPEQLQGTFHLVVEEMAARVNLDPDKLRQLLVVVRTLVQPRAN